MQERREVEPPDHRLASNLRALRERKGWSQSALADAMAERGIPWHQQTVTRIEAGQQQVRFGELMALAAVLETSLDRFTWTSPEAGATEYVYSAGTRVRREAEKVSDSVFRLLLALGGAERALAATEDSEYPRVQEARTDTDERVKMYGLDEAIDEGIRRYEERTGTEEEGQDD
jgi:transcriptional regulator with XRE-family HTH domain